MCRTADCNCSQISAHATLQRCSRGRRCCKLDPRWDSNIRPTYFRTYLSTCRAWPAHLVINIRSIEVDTDLQTLCRLWIYLDLDLVPLTDLINIKILHITEQFWGDFRSVDTSTCASCRMHNVSTEYNIYLQIPLRYVISTTVSVQNVCQLDMGQRSQKVVTAPPVHWSEPAAAAL